MKFLPLLFVLLLACGEEKSLRIADAAVWRQDEIQGMDPWCQDNAIIFYGENVEKLLHKIELDPIAMAGGTEYIMLGKKFWLLDMCHKRAVFAHECVHLLQAIEAGGAVAGSINYAEYWWENYSNGMSTKNSYKNSPLEVEARAEEKVVLRECEQELLDEQ